ncbi:histone-lysine N-methyltransferase SETMAR [Trichonephila clavipes]|nr:histone-lysine N-methyltransferase SETMAR [Trichonephila clavipes]
MRGFAARWLFRVPVCREGTIHLQTSMSSPGFELKHSGTAVSVANHYSGWVTSYSLRGFNHVTACSFDVKDAPHTGRPVVENVDKITEIMEVDCNVSSRSIAQDLKIDHKTVLNHLRKVGFKKKLDVWVPINTKKHDGSNFHLRFHSGW